LACLLGGCRKTAPPREPEPLELLDRLWRQIAEKYPALDYVGIDGDALLAEYRPRVAMAPTRQAALEVMAEMVARLSDHHTRLEWPEEPRKTPGIYLEPVLRKPPARAGADEADEFRPFLARPGQLEHLEPYAIAVAAVDPGVELLVGDEIVSLDGAAFVKAVKTAWPRAAGASHLARLRAASELALFGPPDSEATFMVARAGELITVKTRRAGRHGRPPVALRTVEGVPVIRITSWSDDGQSIARAVDELLLAHRNDAGLVFDVRGNPGGSDNAADAVTGRFIDRPVVSSLSFVRGEAGRFTQVAARAQPRGPWRFGGRVAVLVDEGCQSACVHFASGMRAAGARLFGATTDGACGFLEEVALATTIKLVVARTFPIQSNGLPALLGIRPHEPIPLVLDDLIAGRDRVAEAAASYVRGTARED
jgi:C-terminal processing protease CtpA/Prc